MSKRPFGTTVFVLQKCLQDSITFVDYNIDRLLPLIDYYQMTGLMEKCEEYLLTKPCVHSLMVADKFNLKRYGFISRKLYLENLLGI